MTAVKIDTTVLKCPQIGPKLPPNHKKSEFRVSHEL